MYYVLYAILHYISHAMLDIVHQHGHYALLQYMHVYIYTCTRLYCALYRKVVHQSICHFISCIVHSIGLSYIILHIMIYHNTRFILYNYITYHIMHSAQFIMCYIIYDGSSIIYDLSYYISYKMLDIISFIGSYITLFIILHTIQYIILDNALYIHCMMHITICYILHYISL